MWDIREVSAGLGGVLTPRSANPAARHHGLPAVRRSLLRSGRPRPHPVALMEQVTQGLLATPGGPVNLSTGAAGWVMVDQNLTGDHGGSRVLGWAPGSFKSLVPPGDTLQGPGGACVPLAVLQTGPLAPPPPAVRLTQHLRPGGVKRDSLPLHPPAHVQEPSRLWYQLYKAGGGRRQHSEPLCATSGSLGFIWKSPLKLLGTWFRGMEGEKALISQIRGY